MKLLLAFLLGGVFLLSGLSKARSLGRFAAYLSASLGIDARRATAAAAGIVSLEIVLAVCSLIWITPAVIAVDAVFLIGATAFLGSRVLAGDSRVCACFGPMKAGLPTKPVPITHTEEPAATLTRVLTPVQQTLRNTVIISIAALLLLHLGVAGRLAGLLVFLPTLIMLAFLAISLTTELRKLRAPVHPRRDYFAPMLAPLVILDFYKPQYRTSQ